MVHRHKECYSLIVNFMKYVKTVLHNNTGGWSSTNFKKGVKIVRIISFYRQSGMGVANLLRGVANHRGYVTNLKECVTNQGDVDDWRHYFGDWRLYLDDWRHSLDCGCFIDCCRRHAIFTLVN